MPPWLLLPPPHATVTCRTLTISTSLLSQLGLASLPPYLIPHQSSIPLRTYLGSPLTSLTPSNVTSLIPAQTSLTVLLGLEEAKRSLVSNLKTVYLSPFIIISTGSLTCGLSLRKSCRLGLALFGRQAELILSRSHTELPQECIPHRSARFVHTFLLPFLHMTALATFSAHANTLPSPIALFLATIQLFAFSNARLPSALLANTIPSWMLLNAQPFPLVSLILVSPPGCFPTSVMTSAHASALTYSSSKASPSPPLSFTLPLTYLTRPSSLPFNSLAPFTWSNLVTHQISPTVTASRENELNTTFSYTTSPQRDGNLPLHLPHPNLPSYPPA